MTRVLLSFGHGYVAQALARLLLPQGWRITGTTRDPRRSQALQETGVEMVTWPGQQVALESATHMLISIPPTAEGDPVLGAFGERIAAMAPRLQWVGYLSTTAVYGDHGGDWVDENAPLSPVSQRGRLRVAAEQAWAAIPELPLHIFRLAGIYGPGRGPFAKLRTGKARRIIKPGQVFSRIHVEDAAQVLAASIARPSPGGIYNVCDNDPAPPQDVIEHAACLLGLPPPPAEPFETADLSPMARSFYGENKRVRNDRIRNELGVRLKYPDYRSGLRSLLADDGRGRA